MDDLIKLLKEAKEKHKNMRLSTHEFGLCYVIGYLESDLKYDGEKEYKTSEIIKLLKEIDSES